MLTTLLFCLISTRYLIAQKITLMLSMLSEYILILFYFHLIFIVTITFDISHFLRKNNASISNERN